MAIGQGFSPASVGVTLGSLPLTTAATAPSVGTSTLSHVPSGLAPMAAPLSVASTGVISSMPIDPAAAAAAVAAAAAAVGTPPMRSVDSVQMQQHHQQRQHHAFLQQQQQRQLQAGPSPFAMPQATTSGVGGTATMASLPSASLMASSNGRTMSQLTVQQQQQRPQCQAGVGDAWRRAQSHPAGSGLSWQSNNKGDAQKRHKAQRKEQRNLQEKLQGKEQLQHHK
ncbi:unnamed protein product, partial [Ascophyllum nodosum]